jgi:hypothetical protein
MVSGLREALHASRASITFCRSPSTPEPEPTPGPSTGGETKMDPGVRTLAIDLSSPNPLKPDTTLRLSDMVSRVFNKPIGAWGRAILHKIWKNSKHQLVTDASYALLVLLFLLFLLFLPAVDA